jgi:hypothetical protein
MNNANANSSVGGMVNFPHDTRDTNSPLLLRSALSSKTMSSESVGSPSFFAMKEAPFVPAQS